MKKLIYSLIAITILAGCNKSDISYSSAVRVKTLGASMIYSDQVTLAGAVDSENGVAISEVGFYLDSTYIDPATFDHALAIVAETGSTVFTTVVPNLNPETQYYMVAYARDLNGTLYYGGEIPLRTDVSLATAISTPAVKSGTLTAKSSSFTGKLVEDSGIPIIEYGIEFWPTSEDLEAAVLCTIPAFPTYIVAKGDMFTVPVAVGEGLLPGTEYTARLYARNGIDGVYTENFTFSTPSVAAPQVISPTTLVNEAGPNNITFNATLVSMGNDPETIFGVAYKKTSEVIGAPDNTWTHKTATTTPLKDNTTEQFTIDGLVVSTGYSVVAYAINENSTDPVYGSVFETSTMVLQDPVCTVMQYVAADYETVINTTDRNVAGDYVYLRGGMTSGGHTLTEYGFRISTTADFAAGTFVDVIVTGTPANIFMVKFSGLATPAVITKLLPATRYYYKSWVKNDANTVYYSAATASIVPAAVFAKDGATFLARYKHVASGGTGPLSSLQAETPTKYLYYYELAPVVVNESGGNYNYYFLDRNLGAERQPTTAEMEATSYTTENMTAYVGYHYLYGYALPATGWGATVTGNGNPGITAWVNTLRNPNYSALWSSANDPCPASYSVPSKAEFDAYQTAISANDVKLLRAYLHAPVSGVRNTGNGALQAGTPQRRFWWGFWTTSGYYYNTGIDDTAFLPFVTAASSNVETCNGIPVRCMRKELIVTY